MLRKRFKGRNWNCRVCSPRWHEVCHKKVGWFAFQIPWGLNKRIFTLKCLINLKKLIINNLFWCSREKWPTFEYVKIQRAVGHAQGPQEARVAVTRLLQNVLEVLLIVKVGAARGQMILVVNNSAWAVCSLNAH